MKVSLKLAVVCSRSIDGWSDDAKKTSALCCKKCRGIWTASGPMWSKNIQKHVLHISHGHFIIPISLLMQRNFLSCIWGSMALGVVTSLATAWQVAHHKAPGTIYLPYPLRGASGQSTRKWVALIETKGRSSTSCVDVVASQQKAIGRMETGPTRP